MEVFIYQIIIIKLPKYNKNNSNLNGITYDAASSTTTLSNNVSFIGTNIKFGNSLQTTTLNLYSGSQLNLNGSIYLPFYNISITQLLLSFMDGLNEILIVMVIFQDLL